MTSENKIPLWLKVKAPDPIVYRRMEKMLSGLKLNTVCQSAGCPNIGYCFGKGTATFLIMGNICTRNCLYCGIPTGKPLPLDHEEPDHIAKAVSKLGLEYVVLTSVTRDDLKDGGALHYLNVIKNVRYKNPYVKIEVLIPDFKGDYNALKVIEEVAPDVINHNIETVERLFPIVRSGANYNRSLSVLNYFSQRGFKVKSGFMLGLGEKKQEVKKLLNDLLINGVRGVTIGQYLRPTPRHYSVVEYLSPEVFSFWKRYALDLGFFAIESGPLVRSSYNAKGFYEMWENLNAVQDLQEEVEG